MLDELIGFFRVIGTEVVSGAVRMSLSGIGSLDPDADPEDDEKGEAVPGQIPWGPLGIIVRPRAPSTRSDGTREFAEAIGLKHADDAPPFAYRDSRLHRRFAAPKDGSIAFVGYGGAFLAFDDTGVNSGDEKATIATLYVPYAWAGGVAGKAHVLEFDTTPGNESVVLAHGDGFAISMFEDEGITMRADISTFVNIKPGKIQVNADEIALQGNCSAGVPVLPGAPILLNPTSVSASVAFWP